MSLKPFIRNRLEPGSHICLLYASESEHIEAVSTFFQQAIAAGARIFYTCSQHTPHSLQSELLQVGIDLRPLIERGQVTLLDTRQVALPVDRLAAPLMPAEMLRQARQAGYPAVYLSTEIPISGEHNLDQLLPDLEIELNNDQAPLPAIYLCQYDRRSFSPQALTDALVTHPLVMVDGEILENHFYIAPEALGKHSPGASRFDFLLNQLLDHQKMEKRIRRTEQMYESVATASPDGILLLTPDAFIRFASPKALALFGYQRLEQLFGSSIWELFAPEDLPRATAHFHSTSPLPAGEEHLYRMQRNDGSRLIGELDLAAFWDDDGQLEGSVGIIRDVTARVTMQEALAEKNRALAAAYSELEDKNQALAAAYTELEDKNQDLAAAYFELENKNQALASAYQATIEGWSRALELRDKETQGHSQRVVALTVKLAERLRVAPGEMIYIRWGALLHDIGKMGIPDAILLKPSTLSDDDWVTMKKHPELAFKWLSGIAYLEPALDIPHYHHEHWDGSGYPCGLRAAAIPLPARIFAVIDNWDALLANRPYRPAWPRAEVVNYLRAQSGRKFDPSIVDVFLEMIKE